MADPSITDPLQLQPADLSETEKRYLLDIENGVTRVIDADMFRRMQGFGLLRTQDRKVQLTGLGRLFCREYAKKIPPFSTSLTSSPRTGGARERSD
jgi:hypothetical protein